jgi:Tol biopolymer transport system component
MLCSGVTGAQTIERLSTTNSGAQPDGASLHARSNADGSLVVFLSSASNLVPNDRNGRADIFVLDRLAGVTERVSLSFLGGDPNDTSFPAVISADGRFVAFGCAASNIVTGDFNRVPDIFVFDRVERRSEILSLSQDGQGGGAVPDLPPAITPEGRFVAFASQADNLVANDANQASDVFVVDRDDGRIELITYTALGAPDTRSANDDSAGPMISQDGCVVAFFSDATNLVPMDTNQFRDVFVRDRCSGGVERVSVNREGAQANGPSQIELHALGLSADGRFVLFTSRATNLDEIPTGGTTQIFLRDRATGATQLVSRNAGGEAGNGLSVAPSISADGRFVAFQSLASNLVDDDVNGRSDVFVLDRTDGEVRLVSQTADGRPSDGDSTVPSISDDGSRIVFQSSGRLTPDDLNNLVDTYSVVNPMYGKPLPQTPTPDPSPTASATAVEEETPTAVPTPEPPTVTPTRQAASPTASLTATALPTLPEATRTATAATVATATPVVPTPSAAAATATRTATASASPRGGSGGGGCSCRIDPPQTGREAGQSGWPAAALPVVLWGMRRRHLRLRQPS